MHSLTRYMALLALVLALACSGDDDDAPTDATNGVTVASATATPESGEEKPTAAATPDPGDISVANEPFSVETSDGVVLKGHAYTPSGPKRQALVIVAPVEQSTWAESTDAFTSEGIAVFTFDLRGYGETAGDADAGSTTADAQLVSRFVGSREYPLVYLFGAGEEAGEAVTAAAAGLDELSGVITYGYAGDGASDLSLAPETDWQGEDVLAESTVVQPMLETMLQGN